MRADTITEETTTTTEYVPELIEVGPHWHFTIIEAAVQGLVIAAVLVAARLVGLL
jgi:hypothetical protein